MSNNEWISVDVETSMCAEKKLMVISVCDAQGDASIIYKFSEHTDESLKAACEYLDGKNWLIHNAWFDVGVLYKLGITCSSVYCTMTGESLVCGNGVNKPLGFCIKKYIGLEIEKDLQTSDWSKAMTDEQVEYCLNDVKFLHRIKKDQEDYLTKRGMMTHLQLKNEYIRAIGADAFRGVPMDKGLLDDIAKRCRTNYRKQLTELLDLVPLEMFFKSTFTIKALRDELTPYSSKVIELKKRTQMEELLESGELDDAVRSFIIDNPFNKTLLISIEAPAFASNCAEHFGVDVNSFSVTSKRLMDFLDDEKDHPFTKVMELIFAIRLTQKVLTTYADPKPEKVYTDSDGLMRRTSKVAYTSTGRITFTPFAQFPKEGSGKCQEANELRSACIAPKGYKIASLDYASIEDVLMGLVFNDKAKQKILREGYDQYLLFASKLFGTFDYTDPSQTEELKTTYKGFRQAVKAISLASNYNVQAKKVKQMYDTAMEEMDLDNPLTGEEILDKWRELYEGIYEFQKHLNDFTCNTIQSYYDKFDFDNGDMRSLKTFNLDPFSQPCKLRANVLRDSGLVISASSVLGLKRDYVGHQCFSQHFYGSKKAHVQELGNVTIQSTGAELLMLATILVKAKHPEVIIPFTIHDSIIAYIPDDDNAESVKESMLKLMETAGYMIVGYGTTADGGITDRGF